MKKRLPTIILIIVFLVGLSLLLYPTVSNWWNNNRVSHALDNYRETIEKMDSEDIEAKWRLAEKYNRQLVKREGAMFSLSDSETEEYNSLLDIGENRMMGYLEIPMIEVKLPIYHGLDDAILSIGIGHIPGSSLPTGGGSTHCVLSGHRGLPSAQLLTRLDEMVEGDIFLIHVLDQTLTYEVDQIRVVEPSRLSDLAIEKGKDYCTLVTCTPYGINTHRLLVRGHRIDNLPEDRIVSSEALPIDKIIVASVIAAIILLILLNVLLLKTRKRKHRSK